MWRKGARAFIQYRRHTRRAGRSCAAAAPRRISCVICAYNEADRIGHVLKAVSGHPLLHEIIVVDDGSTDATLAKAAAFADITIISLWPNGGKTQALATGVAAASGDYVMLLDADLDGLTAAEVSKLAAPVLAGEADSSISLRGDSLGVYRAMGLDFVSGERVLPRALFGDPARTMADLPRWGCEVFINERIIEMGLRVSVVDWRHVFHTPKHRKVGAWRGVTEELRMVGDALRVISPAGVVRQHVELKRLSRSA
jgi:glycosyltransferase involved in cell wall biosynthesis